MSGIIPGFEYDIFISYRQRDNRYDGWVSRFVDDLKKELDSTFKEEITIYFDEDPHDRLLDNHIVGKSLEGKLNCLIFIPVISRTYCDPNSFAWESEFRLFNRLSAEDGLGRDIKLPGGNYAGRILPVRIHDLEEKDISLLRQELNGELRAIDFIYRAPGVNRPLNPSDNPDKNLDRTFYRDQINKVANSVQEIVNGIRQTVASEKPSAESPGPGAVTPGLSFRTKLRTRNILRICASYILTAILVWKAVAIGSTILGLSEKNSTLTILLLAIFFPLAVLLAWFYERSPAGLLRTGSEDSKVNPYDDFQKRPLTSNAFFIVLTITSLLLFLFFPANGKSYWPSDPVIDKKSIAVLPFIDMSPEKSEEYLSFGMMEEILDNLYRIGDLKVISRASSMRYKGETKKTIREIAAELGVANILTGSVLHSDSNIRISIQLIDAATGQYLWMHNYESSFRDVFSTQNRAAQEVATILKAEISPGIRESMGTRPPGNPEAYAMYIRGVSQPYNINQETKIVYYNIRNKTASMEFFRKAIGLDSTFSPPYAALGFMMMQDATFMSSDTISTTEVWKTAKKYLEKSVQLDPGNGEAHKLMAMAFLWYEWNFRASGREYQIAKRIYPNFSWTDFLLASGRFEEAYTGAMQNIETDRNNAAFWAGAIISTYFAGKNPDRIIRKAMSASIDKNDILVRTAIVKTYFYRKKFDKAGMSVRQIAEDMPDISSSLLDAILASCLIAEGRKEEAGKIISELERRSERRTGGSPSYCLALIYAVMNDGENVMNWLEKAYANHDVELYWMKVEPFFQPFKKDPRYQDLLKKIGFPE